MGVILIIHVFTSEVLSIVVKYRCVAHLNIGIKFHDNIYHTLSNACINAYMVGIKRMNKVGEI